MSLGTIEIRRPRVRNLDERFVSKVLPLFKRQTHEVRDLISTKTVRKLGTPPKSFYPLFDNGSAIRTAASARLLPLDLYWL